MKISLGSLCLLSATAIFAQQPLPCTNIGVSDLSGPTPYIIGSCLEVSSDLHTNAMNVLLEADQEIHLLPGTQITPNAHGSFHACIRTNALPLAWYEPSSLGSVGVFEKMEIGIMLPADIDAFINIFLESGASALSPTRPGINPFNPEEVNVYMMVFDAATFNGNIQTSPIETIWNGFFYRDFQRAPFSDEYIEVENDYMFRIRYAPQTLGLHYAVVVAQFSYGNRYYTSAPFAFNVVPSNNPGYVVVGDSKRFLKRGEEMFFPIGCNMSSPSCHGDGQADPITQIGGGECSNSYLDPSYSASLNEWTAFETYLRWSEIDPKVYDFYLNDINVLAQNGANVFRMNMAPWISDFEYERLNNYDTWFSPQGIKVRNRAQVGWELDKIFNEAEENDIAILLTSEFQFPFFNEGSTSGMVSGYWDWTEETNDEHNLGYGYHSDLGLEAPLEFLTDPEAIKYYQYKLRYLVARWGYSTSIFAYQLIGEINSVFKIDESDYYFEDPNDPRHLLIQLWHTSMSNYLKDELHVPQMVSVQYAGLPCAQNANEPYTSAVDRSFYLSNINFPTYSLYSFMPSRYERLYNDVENWFPATKDIFNDIYPSSSYNYYHANQKKPFFNTEIGSGLPSITYTCSDYCEWIKDVYISPFTGVAGMSLVWDNQWAYFLWPNLQHVAGFLAPYNFDESAGNVHGWVAGHDYDKTHTGIGVNKYGVSDLFYLRSPNREEAIGVIGNRTYNFFTQWGCSSYPFDTLTDLGASEWRTFYRTGLESGSDSLNDDYLYTMPSVSLFYDEHIHIINLKGYPTKRYVIEYFSAWNPDIVIKTEVKRNDNWNGLKLEFPATTGTSECPIVLVKVYPYKNKSSEVPEILLSDSLGDDEIQYSYNTCVENPFHGGDVKVYPNPFSSSMNIKLPGYEVNSTIMVYDLSGRKLMQLQTSKNATALDLAALQPGAYILAVLLNGDLFHFKIIKQ